MSEQKTNGFCGSCGTPIPVGVRFCPECGTKVEAPVGVAPVVTSVQETPKKKKNLLVKVAIILVALLVAYGGVQGATCLVAKKKVVGTWKSESVYLKKYGGSCVRYMVIEKGGSWSCVGMRLSDGQIVFTEFGTWKMEGKSAVLSEPGEPGISRYTYHLNDILKNGDIKYERLDD